MQIIYQNFMVRHQQRELLCDVAQFRNQVIIMASKRVYDAMEADDWGKVHELITTASWTPADLENKHGVHNISCGI